MAISVSNQSVVFLAALIVGVLLGVLYDCFRIFRLAFRSGRVAIFFQDMLFVLVCTVVTFLFLLRESAGSVRFFILEGEILGAVLYYCTLGVLTMKAAKASIEATRRAARKLKGLVEPPVRRAYAKTGRSLRSGTGKAKKYLRKENNLLQIRLKVMRGVLYNHLCIQKRQGAAVKPKKRESGGKRRDKTS